MLFDGGILSEVKGLMYYHAIVGYSDVYIRGDFTPLADVAIDVV